MREREREFIYHARGLMNKEHILLWIRQPQTLFMVFLIKKGNIIICMCVKFGQQTMTDVDNKKEQKH